MPIRLQMQMAGLALGCGKKTVPCKTPPFDVSFLVEVANSTTIRPSVGLMVFKTAPAYHSGDGSRAGRSMAPAVTSTGSPRRSSRALAKASRSTLWRHLLAARRWKP